VGLAHDPALASAGRAGVYGVTRPGGLTGRPAPGGKTLR